MDIHDPKVRTSTTPSDLQKLRSEKLWAEFSFPPKRRGGVCIGLDKGSPPGLAQRAPEPFGPGTPKESEKSPKGCPGASGSEAAFFRWSQDKATPWKSAQENF